MEQSFFSCNIVSTAAVSEAFGPVQDIFAALRSGYSAFDSCHIEVRGIKVNYLDRFTACKYFL